MMLFPLLYVVCDRLASMLKKCRFLEPAVRSRSDKVHSRASVLRLRIPRPHKTLMMS